MRKFTTACSNLDVGRGGDTTASHTYRLFFSVLRAYAYPPAVPCSYLNLRSLPETCDCRAQNYAHGKHKFCYEPSQKHTAKSRFVVCPTRKHTAKLEHTAVVPSMQCANLWHTANSASKHGSWQTVKFVVCQRSTRQIKPYVVCFIRGRRQNYSKKNWFITPNFFCYIHTIHRSRSGSTTSQASSLIDSQGEPMAPCTTT